MSEHELFALAVGLVFAIMITVDLFEKRVVVFVLKRSRRWFRRRHTFWQGLLLIVWGATLTVVGLTKIVMALPDRLIRDFWPQSKLEAKERSST